MDTTNFVIEHTVTFNGNTGPFNEQPVFTFAPNKSLSGVNFINISRIRSSTDEGASGLLVLYVGSISGLLSVTGSHNVDAISVTGSTTCNSTEYKISTIMNDAKRLDVIIKNNGIFFGDITLTGFHNVGDMNYMINGLRPEPEVLPTDGTTGQSLLLYYTYNREELSSSLTSVVDRSGNSLTGAMKGTLSAAGTSASVTGWSYSPLEGGLRLDGGGWLESETSSKWAPTQNASSAMTLMMFAKWAATGNSSLICKGVNTTRDYGIYDVNGVLTLSSNAGSITDVNINPGRWYHLTMRLDATTANTSGMYLYINGVSSSFTAITTFDETANSRLVFGKELDLVNSGFTGSVGLTRMWNRALSSEEIMMNYLSTIPSMATLNSINLG
jgi:hypothetical protein